MKHSFFESKRNTLAVAVVASGSVALLGWGLNRPTSARTDSAAGATSAAGTKAEMSPTEFLASVPDATSLPLVGADKEIAKWKAKISEKPENPNAWIGLGDGLMQKARDSASHHYYDFAEKAYLQALTLDPKKADAMAGLAWVAGGRHQFDKSIEWATKTAALNPNDSTPYGLIGDAQIEQGKYEDAYVSYQKMLDIRPDLSSYSRGAHLLYLSGDSRKAMWLMIKAIKAGGQYAENTAWCRANLADMLMGMGAVVPAEGVLKDALALTPNNYHCLAGMARVKAARRDYPAAIALYKKAVAIAPQHAGLVALGDLYVLTGDKTEAENTFQLVEKIHEDHRRYGDTDELYMARFWADHDRQLDRALKIVEPRQNEKNAVYADTVAWCFYKNDKLPQAKAAIDHALAAIRPDAATLYHAGMIYAKLGQRVPASKYLYQALSNNPNFDLLDPPLASATLQKLGSALPAAPPGSISNPAPPKNNG